MNTSNQFCGYDFYTFLMAFKDPKTKSMIITYDKNDEGLRNFLFNNGLLILNKFTINSYKAFIAFIKFIYYIYIFCIYRMVSKEMWKRFSKTFKTNY